MPESTITITVNGEQKTIQVNTSLAELLQLLNIEGRLAIDVNGKIIPRSAHAAYQLAENDRVEIVHAIGGG